ncbi:uncharacterized protein LOC120536383 [Polypterus senegalus]|uniref:uncharacterized protein LOC120536383 n=1 Tax=Polypterus senegalus TaxID=55291 RepID=UPI001962D555|nr:uncharacterized protein LOC120536383 [Polypterus senegalus]
MPGLQLEQSGQGQVLQQAVVRQVPQNLEESLHEDLMAASEKWFYQQSEDDLFSPTVNVHYGRRHDLGSTATFKPTTKMHTWILVPVILSYVSPVLAFEVICKPKFLHMFVGYNTSLRCFWKCESKCAAERIIWTKDDHVLQAHPPLENQNNTTADDRTFMYQNAENGAVSLNIERLQMSDTGTYECSVISDGDHHEGKIYLQVSDLNQKSDFHGEIISCGGLFNFNIFGLILVVLGIVLSVLACVLWRKKFGCTYYYKEMKLPYSGDVEDNISIGSVSSKSELIKKV